MSRAGRIPGSAASAAGLEGCHTRGRQPIDSDSVRPPDRPDDDSPRPAEARRHVDGKGRLDLARRRGPGSRGGGPGPRPRRAIGGRMNEARALLVIGAGDATGGAIARRFAREGYIACVTRRTADKLEPLVAADPRRRRAGARLRQRRAQGGGDGRAGREDRARDRADRGGGVQHRRQRALPHHRDHGARLHQGLGDGLFRRLPDGARGGQGDAAARPRHDHLHRRHGQPARARRASPPSPAPSTRCAHWRRAWRANSGRRASTSRTP